MFRFFIIAGFFSLTAACGSSTPPQLANEPEQRFTPIDDDVRIGEEGQPCDSQGGCFEGLVCENDTCVKAPAVDSGSSDGSSEGNTDGSSDGAAAGTEDAGSSDGSSTGTAQDAGSTDGSSDGAAAGTEDAGSSDGSPTGTAQDAGSTDGSSDGAIDGSSDGSADGSSTGTAQDAGSTDGSSDGSIDGSSDGSADGSSDGSSDGSEPDAGPISCMPGDAPVFNDGLFRYVDNAGFEGVESCDQGPLGWAINPLQSTTYTLAYDGEARGNIMEIDRSVTTGSGHWAFMTQSKELFVNHCSELKLSGEVRPVFQSLSSPGQTQGEFPVHVRIIYEDESAQRYLYQVGVHYRGTVGAEWLPPETDAWGGSGCPGGPCAAYETFSVPEDEWYTLPELDLMSISPRPYKLISFRLGSSGHRFTAKFDNVQLTGSDADWCGTQEETDAPKTMDAGSGEPPLPNDAGNTDSMADAGTSNLGDAADAGGDGSGEVLSAASETTKLAVSQDHACAIDAAGALKCWRFVGNLSAGWEAEALDLQFSSEELAAATIFESVSVGYNAVYAIAAGGELHAWDGNGSQQDLSAALLAEGNPVGSVVWDAIRANPVPADNTVPFACGIHAAGGEFTCWGDSFYTTNYNVTSEDGWLDLELYGERACALDATHKVTCYNVGYPNEDSITPGFSEQNWLSLSHGDTQACGLSENGTVACWNAYNLTPSPSSTHESGGWTSFALGDGFRACGIRDAHLKCWEYRNNIDQEALPDGVGLPTNAVHVVMQSNRVCTILEDGTFFCWSWEYDSSVSPYLEPLPVLEGLTVVP